jgi:hypothetical protein
MYLYRESELLVGSRSESLITDQLTRFHAVLADVDPQLDVVRFLLPPDVDIPGLVEELLGGNDRLQVSPNHVFWVAAEEEEAAAAGEPPGIHVPGFGFVGTLLDTKPLEPAQAVYLDGTTVAWIDTALFDHPVLSGFQNIRRSKRDHQPQTTSVHGTVALGAVLVRVAVGISLIAAVDDDGFVDELTLAKGLAATSAQLACLPLGGFTHGDRSPVALEAIVASDCLLIAAAGNHGGGRPFWPAALPRVVAVGAAYDDGEIARWSGRGEWVDRYEPGLGLTTVAPPDRWVRASGTSIAVASLTAKVLSAMAEHGVGPAEALEISKKSSPQVSIQTVPDAESRGSEPTVEEPAIPAVPVLPPALDERRATIEDPTASAAGPPQPPATGGVSPSGSSLAIAPATRLAPGYAPDTFERDILVEGERDALGIRNDIDVLADVIASKHVNPPLSLGIFGDWGAGKSFLMNQLRLKVDRLAKASRSAASGVPVRPSYYHQEICQIDFNAWQYVGGQQLWPSLISRVFEGIREHLGDDESYHGVLADIDRQDKKVEAAAEKLKQAAQALNDATEPTPTRTLADVEAKNSEDSELKDATDRFTEALGLNKDQTDLRDVANRIQELRTLGGRLRQGWAFRKRGWRTVLVAAGSACLVLLAAATALPGFSRFLALIGALVAPTIAVAEGLLKPTGDALRAGAQILGVNRREQENYAIARAEFDDASAELMRLKKQGPAGLYGFVEDRYKAEDYRKYLGMVPLIRDDLKRLSDLACNKERRARIDRIVLYIDDLDRCPSDQVIKVLESVNLLFGWPLYVVVIAVDSRWLVRSLEQEFGAVFVADSATTPTPQDYLEKIIQIPFWIRPMEAHGFGRLVNTLVRSQEDRNQPTDSAFHRGKAPRQPEQGNETGTGPSSVTLETASAADREDVSIVQTPPSVPERSDPARLDNQVNPTGAETSDGPILSLPGNPSEVADQDAGREANTNRTPVSANVATTTVDVDLVPDTLVISKAELDYIQTLAPLVTTPRGAKRLINTYQLVRASVDQVGAFIASAEYRPPLLLLALVTGSPGLSPPMVRLLLASGEPDLRSYLSVLKKRGPEDEGTVCWREVSRLLDRLAGETLTVADMTRWLPVVGRFSFRPGLAQAAAN